MSNNFSPVIPSLELLMQLKIKVDKPQLIGENASGSRKIIPIIGGEFTGSECKGKILPGGADWLLVRPDESAVIDARFTLQATNGALIYVHDQGLRFGPRNVMEKLSQGELVNPSDYFFRTTTRFETGNEELAWLNNTIAIGSGMRAVDHIAMNFYRLN